MPMANQLDAVPAVRRIETNRRDCSAFEIVGHVSAADVENLCGLLVGAYALSDRIDLVVKVTDYDGVDWAEISSETVTQCKDEAERHVRRCATVGEQQATSRVESLFIRGSGIEIRHFPPEQEAEAWALDRRGATSGLITSPRSAVRLRA